MTKRYSVTEAEESFLDVLQDAKDNGHVELVQKGDPVAVLLSFSEYERLTRDRPDFREELHKFRRLLELENIDLDPDEIWGDLRDSSKA